MNTFHTTFQRPLFGPRSDPFDSKELRCLRYRVLSLIRRHSKLPNTFVGQRLTAQYKWQLEYTRQYVLTLCLRLNVELPTDVHKDIQTFVTNQTSRKGTCLCRDQWYPVLTIPPKAPYHFDIVEGLLCVLATEREFDEASLT